MKIVTIKANGENIAFTFDNNESAGKFITFLIDCVNQNNICQMNIIF